MPLTGPPPPLPRHNDVSDLERLLRQVAAEDARTRRPLNRRFIVVEGLYAATGEPAPLAAIRELKQVRGAPSPARLPLPALARPPGSGAAAAAGGPFPRCSATSTAWWWMRA